KLRPARRQARSRIMQVDAPSRLMKKNYSLDTLNRYRWRDVRYRRNRGTNLLNHCSTDPLVLTVIKHMKGTLEGAALVNSCELAHLGHVPFNVHTVCVRKAVTNNVTP